MKNPRAVSQIGRWLVVLAMVAASAPAWAQGVTELNVIPGTVTQLTASGGAQFNPAISGNLVCYTSFATGVPNVYYVNITAPVETAATTDIGTTYDELCDISGPTIVYTHFLNIGSYIYGYTIGGTGTNPFDISDIADSTSPGISPPVAGAGQIVAWEDDRNGNYDIYAEDVAAAAPTQERITVNVEANSYTPNVWGRNIVYSTQTATGCQVYVTNFDTLVTTQLTNTTGCNQSTDISGNYVVYQGNRTGNANQQQVFVYNLATNTETQILGLGDFQQNPHVSGNWVSYEDVNTTTGAISIFLYDILTGTAYLNPALLGTSESNSVFLNDIDGFNVAFTGNSTGIDHVYVFQFTPPAEVPFASLTAVPIITSSTQSLEMVGTFTLGNGGVVNPLTNTLTLQVGNFQITIPGDSFQLVRAGTYEYKAPSGSAVAFSAILQQLNSTSYAYVFAGTGLSDLPTANPVNVSLAIGNNQGSASVKAVFLKYPVLGGG